MTASSIATSAGLRSSIRQSLGLVLLAGCALCFSRTISAQTLWINPGTGDWNTASNWSLGVPNANSGTAFDAVIENGGAAQLMRSGPSVRRLRVGRAAGGGQLVVDGGGLTVTENFYLNENGSYGTVAIQGGASVTAPTTIVGYSGNNSPFVSSMTIQDSGTTYSATADFVVGLDGTGWLDLRNGGRLSLGGGTLPLRIAVNSDASGTVSFSGDGAVLLASAVQFGAGDGKLVFESDSLLFPTPILGSGSVVQHGGTTTLAAANTYTGKTRILNGTLSISSDSNLGTPPASFVDDQLTLDGGTLRATESFALSGNRGLDLSTDGGTISVDATKTLTVPTITYGNTPFPLVKIGAGKVNFSGGKFQLNGGQSMIVHEGEADVQDLNFVCDCAGTALLAIDNGAVVHSGNAHLGLGGSLSGDTVASTSVSGTGSAWLLGGNLALGSSTSTAVSGSVSVADGAVVSVNNGTGSVTMENGSTLNIGVGAAPGTFNAGSITANGTSAINFNHNGMVSFGVPISGPGHVNHTGSGTTTLSGAQTYYGGTTVSAGTLIIAGSLSPQSPVTVNGGLLLVTGGVGGSTIVNSGGTLGGTGTTGGVIVHSGGTLAPGMSAGTLATGNLTLDPGSTSRFELATPSVVGSNVNDLVAVTGNVIFGGTLSITPLPGFTAGSYPLFTYTNDAVNQGFAFESAFLDTHPGSTISIDQVNKRVMANITAAMLPGDYNGNGIVDAADYVVWRKYQGTTHVLPNDPAGGTIGAAQYTTWRSHFGQPPGSGTGTGINSAIPEPSTSVLLILAAAGWCLCRGRAG